MSNHMNSYTYLKKTAYLSITTAVMLTLSAPAALAGINGETTDKQVGGSNTSGSASIAYCGYVNTGKNSKGKKIWMSTGVQFNSDGTSDTSTKRYPRSPNCPLGKKIVGDSEGPIKTEKIVAAFDADRWIVATSAIIWRAYYSDGSLKGWSVSRANLGGVQPGKIKSYMATAPHPEDTGDRLSSEDGGYQGPDRAFATKRDIIPAEQFMTSTENVRGWRKVNTKQGRDDKNKSPYVANYPITLKNADNIKNLQVPASKDAVYKAVNGQILTQNGQTYVKETRKWLNDSYNTVANIDGVGKWVPLGVMNISYNNDNLGTQSAVQYGAAGDGLKISSMFDLMPAITFHKQDGYYYYTIDNGTNSVKTCTLNTWSLMRQWKYTYEEGTWDKINKWVVTDRDFLEQYNSEPLRKANQMSLYNKWVNQYESDTIYYSGERFESPNTDPGAASWRIKNSYPEMRALVRDKTGIFENDIPVKEPTKRNPSAQRTANYAANHASCQSSSFTNNEEQAEVSEMPGNPTVGATLTGSKTGYAVGNDTSKAAQIVGTTSINKPADVKFDSLNYNIRIEAPAGYRYGTTGKAYKFASTSEIQPYNCNFTDNNRVATCTYNLLNKYPSLAQYPNNLNFNMTTSANLVFYAPTPANGAKYKITSWVSNINYTKARSISLGITVPAPATEFKSTDENSDDENTVKLNPEFTIPAFSSTVEEISGDAPNVNGGSKDLPVVGSVSAN